MDYSPQPVPPGGVVNVHVWTDFVCPFCLLGEGLVKQAVDGLNARIVWMPFELRPHPMPTLRPEDDYLPREWERSVYPMAKLLGVPMKLPTVSPQPHTRKAFLGMRHAIDQGLGDQYVAAVFRAFFQRDQDVGDTEILKTIAAETGLDPAAFEKALDDPALARRHDEALDLARRLGIQAVPSILIGDQLAAGVPNNVEALREVIRETETNLIN